MRRSWKTFFVGAAVVLTAVNPASACRGRFWRHCPPPSCYVQCSPCVVVDCCGESSSELPTPADMPSTPAPSQPAPRVPTPAAPPLPSAPIPQDSLPPLPAPAVEPPAAEPSAPADDMPLPTETPADEPAAPAETPAKPAEDVEDLFKDTDAKPADATPAKPADAAPAKPAEKADDVEDLFKDTDEKKAATSEPAQEEPMDTAPSSEVEDLFSEPTDKPSTSASLDAKQADIEGPADGEESSPMRLWTDNTGKYQVRARLVVVGDRYVRLLKETGKTTTVPFSRLSGSDLAFVQHQVSSELAGNF